ncbi:MAG TPA: hypothetical protein PK018_14555, partial [Candidatus Competibacter sp.]|nr:hypothetical protein [Candidatus Competibacter sp.]
MNIVAQRTGTGEPPENRRRVALVVTVDGENHGKSDRLMADGIGASVGASKRARTSRRDRSTGMFGKLSVVSKLLR